jgi:hypothetical protein
MPPRSGVNLLKIGNPLQRRLGTLVAHVTKRTGNRAIFDIRMTSTDSTSNAVRPAGPPANASGAGILAFRLGTKALVLIYAALLIAAITPVFLVDIPVLIDLPNHLSRMHILTESAANPFLQQHYRLTWGLLPNLAMDAFVVALHPMLSVFEATRVFLAITIVMLVGGTLLIHAALYGRLGLWQTAVFLVIFNQVLAWGFVNFLFGLGGALIAAACWIFSRQQNIIFRIAIFSTAATILFFSHLIALAVYALLIFGYEVAQAKPLKNGVRGDTLRHAMVFLAQMIVPLTLWARLPGGAFEAQTAYVSAGFKVLALTAPFRFFFEPVDFATIVLLATATIIGLRSKRIRIAPEMVLTVSALAALSLVMPHYFIGIFAVDQRFAIVTAFLLIATMNVSGLTGRQSIAIACVAFALFAWRIVGVAQDWRHINQQFAEFRTKIAAVEKGAHILVAQRKPDADYTFEPNGSNFAFWHLASLAVIDRDAFIPLTFTTRYQPIKVQPDKAAISSPEGKPISYENLTLGAAGNTTEAGITRATHPASGYWTDWPKNYDYVLVLDYGQRENPAPDILTPSVQGSFFTIFENRSRRR